MATYLKSCFASSTYEFTVASYNLALAEKDRTNLLNVVDPERTIERTDWMKAQTVAAEAFEKAFEGKPLPAILLLQEVGGTPDDRPLVNKFTSKHNYTCVQASNEPSAGWTRKVLNWFRKPEALKKDSFMGDIDCAILTNPKDFRKTTNISSCEKFEVTQARVTHRASGAVLSFASIHLPNHSLSGYVDDMQRQKDVLSEGETIEAGNSHFLAAYRKLDEDHTNAAFIGGDFNSVKAQLLHRWSIVGEAFADPMHQTRLSTYCDIKEQNPAFFEKKVDYLVWKNSSTAGFISRQLDNIRCIFFSSVKQITCVPEKVSLFTAPEGKKYKIKDLSNNVIEKLWPWDFQTNASDHRPIFFKVSIETQPSWINRKILAIYNKLAGVKEEQKKN